MCRSLSIKKIEAKKLFVTACKTTFFTLLREWSCDDLIRQRGSTVPHTPETVKQCMKLIIP